MLKHEARSSCAVQNDRLAFLGIILTAGLAQLNSLYSTPGVGGESTIITKELPLGSLGVDASETGMVAQVLRDLVNTAIKHD